MNIISELKSRFRAALAGLTDSPEEYLDQVRPSQDPKFGDYQANLAMPLGKRLKRRRATWRRILSAVWTWPIFAIRPKSPARDLSIFA